jgi:long-chain acyl-CoA synthetase
MFIDFLVQVFEENPDAEAIVWRNVSTSYSELLHSFRRWQAWLVKHQVSRGSVVAIEGDFSPNSIALMLALIEAGCITVPLTSSVSTKKDEYIDISEVEYIIEVTDQDEAILKKRGCVISHELLIKLKEKGHPGLVLFSSGSSGKSKAAVHDLLGILEKFKTRRQARRAVTFLLYDHIGGFNTLLYQLSNAGCIVTLTDRTPEVVLKTIETHRVELLPTSPTFINLILLSEAWKRYDLSSLQTVTYGTEPMLESTLKRFHELYPNITLQQTYGLSEIGILRSKSKSNDSLWVKLGGEGFETRVVDNILEIKAESAMLGYLNAPSPFTSDGWFHTGDRVIVDGDYYRILGRASEIINVGGQKVYPAEVESAAQEHPNVAEVSVYAESNSILGQIVCASVMLRFPQDPREFEKELRKVCRARLQEFQVPVKIKIVTENMHGDRFKKMRTQVSLKQK